MKYCAGCGIKISGKTAQFDEQPQPQHQQQPQQSSQQPQQQQAGGKKKAGKILAVILIVVAVIAALSFIYIGYALGTPLDMRAEPRGPERLQASWFSRLIRPFDSAGISSAVRDTAKYTFLVLGTDKGEYNTDVIMAVTFDTADRTLVVANIPRDTLVNVSWRTKKANSILANKRAAHSGEDDANNKAMDSTVEAFADILGYETDYWVSVNMKAFVSLVDAIGGVDFHVPVNMNYDDAAGGLSIHYTEGLHHLSGQQALEVLRFRSGYRSGDIGRIGTQQSFLKSVMEQIFENKGSLDVIELAGVLINNVETNLRQSDLIWLGKEFMKLSTDDISFHMMPGNASDSVSSQSYVSIYVDEWLDLVNEKLNPFYNDVATNDVSILTRGADKKLYVTDGNRQGDPSWGS